MDTQNGNQTSTDEPLRVEAAPVTPKRKRRTKAEMEMNGESPVRVKGGKAKMDRRKLAEGLSAAHEIAALHLNAPILKLSDRESENLANATAEILDYYSVQVNPALLMWSNLAIVAGMIYIPRVKTLIDINREMQAQQRKTQQTPNGRQASGSNVATIDGMPVQ